MHAPAPPSGFTHTYHYSCLVGPRLAFGVLSVRTARNRKDAGRAEEGGREREREGGGESSLATRHWRTSALRRCGVGTTTAVLFVVLHVHTTRFGPGSDPPLPLLIRPALHASPSPRDVVRIRDGIPGLPDPVPPRPLFARSFEGIFRALFVGLRERAARCLALASARATTARWGDDVCMRIISYVTRSGATPPTDHTHQLHHWCLCPALP